MEFTKYRLPSGEIVNVDADVARNAETITFELKAVPPALRGQIVIARRVWTEAEVHSAVLGRMMSERLRKGRR